MQSEISSQISPEISLLASSQTESLYVDTPMNQLLGVRSLPVRIRRRNVEFIFFRSRFQSFLVASAQLRGLL